MKRSLSLFLTMLFVLSTLLSINVFAKVDLPTISKSKPLTTYTYNSSGKVYAYTASNLKTKTGGYIACSTDECKIIEICGKAVKVIYPVPNGTKTAWFLREAFTFRDLANDAAKSSFTAQAKATTYKWKGKSNELGYVEKNDKCYLLRGNEDSDWVQIIYPVSKGHKMGWVKGSDYAKMIGVKPTPEPKSENISSDWQYPMKNWYCTWTTKTDNSWSVKNQNKPKDRNDHVGIDIRSDKDSNVYAASSGTVVYKGYSSGNGHHVVLSHKIDGVSVKTLYSHLSSYASCPAVGKSVNMGQKIGVYGKSGLGNVKNGHLHFAIYSGSSNDPWGYASNFSGNKTTYDKCTFYNPNYVIKYKRLP